jgi:hypothetical protein
MIQYSYDKWLRPRPNTQWKNLENQIFVDQSPLSGQFEDEEDSSEDEEEEDTPEGISDNDGSDSDGEYEDESPEAEDEVERSRSLLSSNGTQLADNEDLEAGLNSACHLTPGSGAVPARHTGNDGLYSSAEDDGIVSRFLTVMEELTVKDRDLHRDSIARLRQFFKRATLGCLEEASRGVKSSRILLEDRNFSGKTFRPYPRSMNPKQLYDALTKQVRTIQQHGLSELTTTQRYPETNPPNPATVETGTRRWGQTLKSGISTFFSKINRQSQGATTSNAVDDAPRVWTESEDCPVERRTL